ncbi:MAG: GGDEF domain-containing protein [Acidimicrobiales bacterium]
MAGGLVGQLWAPLVQELSRSASGIGFVYHALDTLVETLLLDDAALVLSEPGIGRQVFRAGRRPLEAAGLPPAPGCCPEGLYAEPATAVEDPGLPAAFAELCRLALRLDLTRRDASHDSLTGLLNRRSFDATLEEFCSRSLRYEWPFLLALIDLDRFKELNDRLGHAGGDSALAFVGAELNQSVRTGDVAARIGGDEFALIVTNGAPDKVGRLLERLSKAVSSSLGHEVGFSTGVAVAPREGTDPTLLFKLADRRLYEDKHRGRQLLERAAAPARDAPWPAQASAGNETGPGS